MAMATVLLIAGAADTPSSPEAMLDALKAGHEAWDVLGSPVGINGNARRGHER
ncbi:MAG: hypothetical protein O7C73_00255 [Nitrospirae bacterium]|nr:hypothetical protein [Nitrospirota bacterium]